MAKINISIELNEKEVENLLEGADDDEYDDDDCKCNCNTSYTKEEMLAANVDELEWDKAFLNKHYLTLRHYPEIVSELKERIAFGQHVVNTIKEE